MKTRKPNGAIIYQGPSMIDGAPIVAIATGLRHVSANSKTGNMVQTWILPLSENPFAAVKSGADHAVCGDCPFRPSTPKDGKPCYVRTFQAPLSVWRAYHRGIYGAIDRAMLAGRMLRMGSYGDPAAVPMDAWIPLIAAAKGRAGYTHQWHRPYAQWLQPYAMASVQSEATFAAADSAGWRTFYVGNDVLPSSRRTVHCPASKESGHRTTCAKCGLCSGTAGKGATHIAIRPH